MGETKRKEERMKLKARICNVKRHTLGFINGSNQKITVKEAVNFTKKGLINGFTVKRFKNKEYVTSIPGNQTTVYDLPEVVI